MFLRLHKTGWVVFLLLILVSCESPLEQRDDNHHLPEGMFPLEFASIDDAVLPSEMYSRITEDRNNLSCYWSEGDRISIQIMGGNNDEEGVCTLDEYGNIRNHNLFWQTASTSVIIGWYPHGTESINLTNQRKELAYVLKSDPIKANYKSGPIRLRFKHQLAKVRIIVSGNMGWLLRAKLFIRAHTSCINRNGNFYPGDTKDYIEMRSIRSRQRIYEATVFPMTITEGEDILQISVLYQQKRFKLDHKLTLEAGKMYSFELAANWFD